MHPSILKLVFALLLSTSASSWETCNLKPLPECHCFGQDRYEVTCSDMDLQEIPSVDPLSYYALEFSNNNISALKDEDLKGVTARSLGLQYNAIATIQDDALKDMAATLQWLDLSHNELTHILPNTLLHRLTKLEKLDLNNNKIGVIPPETDWTKMSNLRQLHLHNNDIWPLALNLPDNLSSYSITHEDSFDMFPGKLPTNIDSLTDLYIVDSHMNFLTLRSLAATFGQNSKLVYLGLDRCRLKTSAFHRLMVHKFPSTLTMLSLRRNDLTDMPRFDNYFYPENFKYLDLAENFLSGLVKEDFEQFEALTYLDLSDSRIFFFLQEGIFDSLGNLQYLSLEGNSLQQDMVKESYLIPKKAITQPGSVRVVLGDIYMECECGIKWLIEQTKRQMSGHEGYLSWHETMKVLKCHEYHPYETFLLIDYDIDKLSC